MDELVAQLKEWRGALERALPWWWHRAIVVALLAFGVVLPFLVSPAGDFMNATVIALAYVVMALGLNIVVGFAGLLDLGYVAFYAIGAYCIGWFGSGFFFRAHVHVLVSKVASTLPGIHLNFLLILLCAVVITSVAGTLIGLPTLRLRGDYIAIVTLAFGEIIGVTAVNGQDIHLGGGQTLTAGNLGIPAVDPPYFPGIGQFTQLNLRPWYWLIFALVVIVLFVNLRVRDSRLGRAWIALREDEVAAVSMGIPLVRTKLLAYAMGAAFGGMAGAFLGALYTSVNAGQFAFAFSIFVLAMIIVGGLGSIWGAVVGALSLSYINYYLIPDVLNGVPKDFGLNFNLTQLSFGIYGFLLVLVMVLRPQGLLPERRRRLELTEAVGGGETLLEEPS
ncbi:MAG TPA: branched-chain amino acid ABC transporter permease [Solirubrobacteraceae bacterium]|nr:branched-chain amino acid ABC transporter permease [Solirubrobacteraceae bacterium]